MTQVFTYEVLRHEWVAQVGHIDQYGNPSTFSPYWTSPPFNNRADAVAALEAHDDVLGYSGHLMRYEVKKSYAHATVSLRKTLVDEYER
jgi:hypothetical protein|tara:strand:- start:39 stop:305 length:267 start_codon:yes stop_codon:yes gene_type:complete